MTLADTIERLRKAERLFLDLAQREHDKALRLPSHIHPDLRMPSKSRESHIREMGLLSHALCDKLEHVERDDINDEVEDYIFLSRKLIAEARHPWIRRKRLEKEQMLKIYQDRYFEGYASGLPFKLAWLKRQPISALNFPPDLELEMTQELMTQKFHHKRDAYTVVVQDVIDHKETLVAMLQNHHKYPVAIIDFRLFEHGLTEDE